MNHFLYRAKYHYGRWLPLRHPVDVTLELSSHCNMACTYCYHADENKGNLGFSKGFMTLDLASNILAQAAELEVPALKFNWKGEATNNPEFYRITAAAKRLARGSRFMERITNSNFKFRHDRDDIFDGLANQTKVKVSMDSFIPDVFAAQRKGGDHSLTLANIDKFHAMKNRGELVIQAVRTKANADEDLRGEINKRWPGAGVSIRDMVGGRLDKDLSALETKIRSTKDRRPCEQAFVRVIFNWKGEAFPCCPDIREQLKIGDINKVGLYEIFNSAFARHLRKSLKNGDAFKNNPCLSCSSYESFKGFVPNWNS